MENPRFIAGELSTHFIDSEQTILEDMKRIIEREKPFEDRLSQVFDERKRIASIAAVAAVQQIYRSKPET